MLEPSLQSLSASTRQRGGMIGLLLSLLTIGALLYFMLRPGARTDASAGVNCEPRIAALVRDTGGIGPQAKAAYDQLPAECRKLLPDPAALAPSPERTPDTE